MSHMPLCEAPSVAGDPGPVEHDGDRLAVQRDVHQQLVEGPVEERRVDRDDRVQPGHRQAGGRGQRVLLGDADVEGPLGEPLGEGGQAGRVQHRRGDRDDVGPLGADPHELVGEGVGPVAGRRAARTPLSGSKTPVACQASIWSVSAGG